MDNNTPDQSTYNTLTYSMSLFAWAFLLFSYIAYSTLAWNVDIIMVNPLTPTSDQDRISPYNINTISSRQVMRIKKNIS